MIKYSSHPLQLLKVSKYRAMRQKAHKMNLLSNMGDIKKGSKSRKRSNFHLINLKRGYWLP